MQKHKTDSFSKMKYAHLLSVLFRTVHARRENKTHLCHVIKDITRNWHK